MLNKSRQSIRSGDQSTNLMVGGNLYAYVGLNVPTELVDQAVVVEVDKLKKSRFFLEFDGNGSALKLGGQLFDGRLSMATAEIRGWGLTWCARLLARSENLDRAGSFLECAKTLGDFSEAKIVDAFFTSQKGDKAGALRALAAIDSDASRSAGLMIVAHHEGAEGALKWIDNAGYTADDLDSDGKIFLLNHQLLLSRWDDVELTVGALSEANFLEAPFLHHLVALATLVPAVPQDFRAIVVSQVPFEAREFRLSSDAVAMDARRVAHKHFLDAAEAATKLACPNAAKVDDEYALWLELRDPAQHEHGMQRLETKLRDPNTALAFVHYALMFGIKLDVGAVERDIERSIAINGGMTLDAALARFSLAFAQPTPAATANYIARHHWQLAEQIDSKLIRYRQIEMLSRAGLIAEANELLDKLQGEGIPAEDESKLRRIISDAQGSDPIESRKAQYESTGSLDDLINLVDELEKHQRWGDLCKFGRLLFEKTHSLSDAERLASAFNNEHRSEALVGFLKANNEFLSQSNFLRMSYAWGLYHEGALFESSAVLAELTDEQGSRNYRALQVNLGIAKGDWAFLTAYIADEYQNRDGRTAQDLISTAQLALHLGLPQAKDLVFAATAKSKDDAATLAAAYFIATNAGWENDPQVFEWFERAIQLSGDDGPFQRMSLKDIVDRKPEWNRRESETWRLLARGQMPTFLAALSLNRTLIDLTAFPAFANLGETDPRRRTMIPAYAGNRAPLEFKFGGTVAALDATALLTLSFLNILDLVLDAFETVHIPHSTLGWLFRERQKVTFHQPSRMVDAQKVRDLLATELLEKFTPNSTASSDLSAQVGDELAGLIAEAEFVPDGQQTQRIVVRPAPVHRLSSLMEEEADLSAHSGVLSSCLAVVEKLRQKSQITADQEKRARAYLQMHERPWPNQPDIEDGAVLFLDDLAVTYLLHLGFLEKLKGARLRAVVSPKVVSETDALISYERISNDVKGVIEDIRAMLSARIESGQVKVGSKRNFDESSEERSIPEHPSVEILTLAPQCDVVICDDRSLNRHMNIDSGNKKTPLFSTMDLLDALVVSGALSDDDRLEHRTKLRRAGYVFIPLYVDELERCLKESIISKGTVIETAELKAIRESVLQVRMSDWLRLPEELLWLDGTLKSFVTVLKGLWDGKSDLEEVIARSNWLLKEIDIRGWAHSLNPEDADDVVRIGRATHILQLLTLPVGVQKSVAEAYWSWLEESILAPTKEQFPEVYKWLVDWHRGQIAKMVEAKDSGKGNS